jgi:hypothetical protein
MKYVSERLREDPFVKFLAMCRENRREWARRRLIRGVLEELRMRRKYAPTGPFMLRMFEESIREMEEDGLTPQAKRLKLTG